MFPPPCRLDPFREGVFLVFHDRDQIGETTRFFGGVSSRKHYFDVGRAFFKKAP
jgi:hypothetical protein